MIYVKIKILYVELELTLLQIILWITATQQGKWLAEFTCRSNIIQQGMSTSQHHCPSLVLLRMFDIATSFCNTLTFSEIYISLILFALSNAFSKSMNAKLSV